jgi:hypothetical protein
MVQGKVFLKPFLRGGTPKIIVHIPRKFCLKKKKKENYEQ